MKTRLLCVTLPYGVWIDGVCHREVTLAPVNGADEQFLMDEGAMMPLAQRTTALLTRCLKSIGTLEALPNNMVRSLPVGDREALLLHLRRSTFGERLQSVLSCPRSECGEKMDLELKVRDLLLAPYDDAAETHVAVIKDDGKTYRVTFRLPTGADQEAVAWHAGSDMHSAAQMLLGRCIIDIVSDDSETIQQLPQPVAEQLSIRMAELDPQAELILDVTCTECGYGFKPLLDIATYFFGELADRARQLYTDVHMLAFYYHWPEAELMAMPASRRRRYTDVLVDALQEGRR